MSLHSYVSGLDASAAQTYFRRSDGGRSSMVESQLVELAVAGSSPVGHPILPLDLVLLLAKGLPGWVVPAGMRASLLFGTRFHLDGTALWPEDETEGLEENPFHSVVPQHPRP